MSNPEYLRRINLAKLYIEKNISGNLILDNVAEAACFSKFHFHRIFTAWTGETPAEYILRIRLETAASILMGNCSMSITEVTDRCGISSPALFSRIFKERFGASPSRFRKESKHSKAESKESKMRFSETAYVEGATFNNMDFSMKAELKYLEALHFAAVTSHTGYNESISRAYAQLMGWMGKNGLLSEPPLIAGISLDNPNITALDKCRYKACARIPGSITASDEVEILDTTAGLHAVLEFTGKEQFINDAYQYLYHTFIPGENVVPKDFPCYQLHKENQQERLNRIFNLTICVPVERM